MNNYWALRREITQNDDSTRPVQFDSQTHNNHQLSNAHLTTRQVMLQRPHNYLMGVNNFNQERYQRNNSVDATTLSMADFTFSGNDTTSFIAAARYGRALPLGLRSSPEPQMSSPNPNLFSSYRANLARNSSSNVVGSQGFATGLRNSSRPVYHNQRNFRYLPYGEGSSRRNNSSLFNDFNNPRSSVDTNRFRGLNDGAGIGNSIPIANPPPPPPRPAFCAINSEEMSMFLSSGNANWDSSRETSTNHRVFGIRDADAWRRTMTHPPQNCFEGLQTRPVELLLFKDDESIIPTSSVAETDEQNEIDDEGLDLSLHL